MSIANATITSVATASLVPFHEMPSCASKHCLAGSPASLPCPTVFTPCSSAPIGAATAPASGDSCVTVPRACYCALPNPLLCGWEHCSWMDWYRAEDWFEATCPGLASLDFSPLPKKCQKCLRGRLFDHGCITYQKNCFCSLRNFLGCGSDCNASQNPFVAEWYADVCAVPLTAASDISLGGIAPGSTGSGGFKFRWYEYCAIVILGLSVVIFVSYFFGFRGCLRKRKLKKAGKKKD